MLHQSPLSVDTIGAPNTEGNMTTASIWKIISQALRFSQHTEEKCNSNGSYPHDLFQVQG